MKRNIVRAVSFVAALLLSLAAVPSAAAASAQAAGTCSAAGVAGQWASTSTGTIIPATGPVVVAIVAIATLDAAGNISGTLTASRGGAVSDETFKGTYTVNADCTGTQSISLYDQSGTLQRSIVWATLFDDNMTESRAIVKSMVLANGTSVPAVVTQIGKKLLPDRGAVASAQTAGTCSTASMAGEWGSTLTGTVFPPTATGAVPFANVARVTYDGAGNISGTQTSSLGGAVSDETIKGTYTVNADCTGTITVLILDPSGNVSRKAVWAAVYDDSGTELRAIIKSLARGDVSVPAIVTLTGKRLFFDDWAFAFQQSHGRWPSAADRADRAWSLQFAQTNGRPPTDAEWLLHALGRL